jgi:outer membrane lipoprotein-sorting protein
MRLTRRTLSLAVIAATVAAPAAAQAPAPTDDKALVEQASAYLEGLREAKARFVQTDARGRTSQGTVYLKRPGKARFEYDPPSGLVVVADGSAVTVADSRLMTFDRYPLGATPLSLVLAKTVRLGRDADVTGVEHAPGGFVITLRDARHKNAGQLALTFAQSPLALTGWAITDAQGGTTRVRLTNLEPASGLDRSMFVGKDPRPPGQRGHS